MTNEEATQLAEEFWQDYPNPTPGGHLENVLCLLHDNEALTDEDRDHLADELEEAVAEEEDEGEVYNDPSTWKTATERT